MQVLRSFYENNALLQYVPPNSDREGKTVSERAPEASLGNVSGQI